MAHIFQDQRELNQIHHIIIENASHSLQNLTAHWTMEAVHMHVFPLVLLESVNVMPDMNYWMMEFPVEVS